MMRCAAVIGMLLVLAAGCSTGRETTATLPAGSAEVPPLRTTGVPSLTARSLGSVLSYVELAEGRETEPRTCSGHLAPVDYKSRLIIDVDKRSLKELAGTETDILPSLSPDTQARLRDLPKLIQDAAAYVADASAMLKAVRVARGAGRDLSSPQITQLEQEIVAQGKKGKDLVDLVIEVARARAQARYGEDEDAVIAEVGRLTSPVVRDAQGQRVILNVEAFGAFLSEEIDFATAQARRDTDVAERQGSVRFRMWARLRQRSDWVSIENYFDAGSFDGPKEPRVSFRMSGADQERVIQGYEIANEAAHFIRDLRNRESSLRRDLASGWETLRAELEDLSLVPADGILPQEVNDLLVEAIDAARSSAGADPQQRAELGRLRTFVVKDLPDDLARIQVLFRGFRATTATEFIHTYIAFTADVQKTLDAVIRLPDTIRMNLGRLQILMDVLGKMDTDQSRKLAAALAEQALPETEKRLGALAREQLAGYPVLATKVKALLTAGQPLNLAEGLDASQERPPVRALELDAVTEGTIDLNRSPADRGDELLIRAELFTTDENGREDVLRWTDQSFRIERFGLTSGFSSNMLFVDRFGSGAVGDPDTNFDPAPSASWNLHYRVPPSAGDSWGRKLYCFFDPGFGINTAALDFEDENVQIGVGAHLTLFEDLLVFGYGYNLQAESDNDYFYFGIGVLEALDTIGGLFGAASGTLNRASD